MTDRDDSAEQHLAVSRIVLRPIGNPLPLGFLALSVATVGFSALRLSWVPATEGRVIALSALLLTAALAMLVSATRFAVTGVYEIIGSPAWQTAWPMRRACASSSDRHGSVRVRGR